MKKRTKVLLIAFSLLIIAGIIFYFTLINVTYYGNMAIKEFCYTYGTEEEYENPDLRKQQMLKELGNFDDYKLNMRKRVLSIFESDAITLVGEYSEENYKKQKNFIETNYQFATKDNKDLFKYEIDEKCAFEFDINKWHFRLLNDTDSDAEYHYGCYIPEMFRIVGFNDTDYKIAFLTFGDSDLDCFGENNDNKDLQEFVNYYFKYNFNK